MEIIRKNGATSNILRVTLRHSSTGQGLTGLTSASTGLIISTITDNEAAVTAYTVAGSTIESITTLGTYAAPTATKCRFKEVDATNHPGLYEIQFADARFAVSSARTLRVCISGATNLLAKDFIVQLLSVDVDDATAFGVSRIDAAISSRSTYAGGDTSGTTTLLSRIASALTITGGKVDVNDKTGFSLSSAAIQAIWDALTSALTTVGSIGKRIADNLDAAISSRSTFAGGAVASVTAGVTVTTNNDKTGYGLTSAYDPAKTASQAGDAMTLTAGERTSIGTAVWASTTRTLSSFGTLVSDIATAVWGAAARTLTAFGFTVDTNANATETAIKAKTDNLPSDPADASDIAAAFSTVNSTLSTIAGYVDTEVAAIKAKTDNLPASPASTGDVTSAVAPLALEATAQDISDRIPDALTTDGFIKADAKKIGGQSPSTPVTVASAVTQSGGLITVTRGTTLTISLTGLGSLVGRDKLYFTVKSLLSQTDEDAIIQIEETDGLVRLNGDEPESASWGSIVVDDADLGDITITINENASSLLSLTERPQDGHYYDVKKIDAGAVRMPVEGKLLVQGDVTRAIE